MYLVFVADNVQEVSVFRSSFLHLLHMFLIGDSLQVLKSYYGIEIGSKACMTMLLIPFLALSWVRDLKSLAPLMMVADMITAVGLIIIMCFLLQNLSESVSAERKIFFTSWHQIALFFSTTVFAFEGISMVSLLHFV